MPDNPRALLDALFDAAIRAAQPATCLPPHLPPPTAGRTIVVGAGKASAAMARAVELAWPTDRLDSLGGLVVTRYGHEVACDRIEIVGASHPVPDEAGRDAARRILDLARGLGPDDQLLCLISGGGSALLAAPGPGLTLEDKQTLTGALLKSGATIHEMNCVRKHLSAVKGGRLAAAAAPAKLTTLLISDVPGDDPATIASGPTVPDSTTNADARAVFGKYGIAMPPSVEALLNEPAGETPKPGDACFANTDLRMVATPQLSLEAAAAAAREAGVTPIILGDTIEGESRDVALVHAGIARQVARHGQPLPAPAVILSGGETTVTVKGGGRGGRNTEFVLALAVALDGYPGIHALACDTDGIDGTEDNAGAVVGPDTLARAAAVGEDAKGRLADNDSYGFFEALGDLLKPGPTMTNVNDFRAVLITGQD